MIKLSGKIILKLIMEAVQRLWLIEWTSWSSNKVCSMLDGGHFLKMQLVSGMKLPLTYKTAELFGSMVHFQPVYTVTARSL